MNFFFFFFFARPGTPIIGLIPTERNPPIADFQRQLALDRGLGSASSRNAVSDELRRTEPCSSRDTQAASIAVSASYRISSAVLKLASCLRREMEKMEEKKNKHGPLAAFLDRFFIGLHLAPAMPLASTGGREYRCRYRSKEEPGVSAHRPQC